MLCRKVCSDESKGSVPVYLNVYDLTPINGYAYWVGLGVYHSGVQVHGIEYAFGAHEYPTTGIFEGEPKQCDGFTFRKTILIGKTDKGPCQVRSVMEELAQIYKGNAYNLITKNCNHFCNDACIKLTGNPIPRWINRLARIGSTPFSPLPIICLLKTIRHFFKLGIHLKHLSKILSLVEHFSSGYVFVVGFLCNCVLPVTLNSTRVVHHRIEDKMVVTEVEGEKKEATSKSIGVTTTAGPNVISSSSSPPPSSSPYTRGRTRTRRALPPFSPLFSISSSTTTSSTTTSSTTTSS